MCEICHQTPCDPRCPNAPEPEPVYICDLCGEGIYDGDRFYGTGSKYICEACLDDMSVDELLQVFGEKLETARQD